MPLSGERTIVLPPAVSQILHALHRHGHEAYVVGGCVRDALLGREPTDWDITTSALPEQVKEVFSATVDTGIQHGTVMVLKNGCGYEVTTYRIDGEYRDGRHPDSVTFTRSLEEDLKRRDFTINAFAWGETGLIDLFQGLEDLERGIIRCVGDPDQRFQEDALRIMRAVRFSAQLGFTIEENTGRMIRRHAPRLREISRERIREEWEKTLLSDHPEQVDLYAEHAIAPFIVRDGYECCFPTQEASLLKELARRRSQVPQEETGRKEAYRILRIAAFFLHLSCAQTDQAMQDLKYDNRTRNKVVRLLTYWPDPLPDDRVGIRRALNRMGPETWTLLLELKDALLRSGAYGQEELSGLDALRQMTGAILRDGDSYSLSQLDISGSDLIRAGYAPGKKIGEMLEKILQKVIESPTLNKKEILCNSDFLEEVEHDSQRGV